MRIRGMNTFGDDDLLPPDLDELGKRLSAERPVASNDALDRVMTRAQRARSTRSGLFWRTTSARMPKMTAALAATGVLAVGGLASIGAFNQQPPTVSDPALVEYANCSQGTNLVTLDAAALLGVNLLANPNILADLFAVLQVEDPDFEDVTLADVTISDLQISLDPIGVSFQICVTVL